MVSTLPASRPSIQINQSSWIQTAMDSRDEMIAREAHGKREEPVEVLEQCKMVTQNDGTSLEKVTDVRSKRKKFWELLENMVSSFSGPWAVIGDLNCIKRAKEKCGGRLAAESSVNCLRDFMMNTAMWTKEEGSRRAMEGAWQTRVEGSHGFKRAKKLSVTCRNLLRWNKENFGNTKEKIKDLQNKISLIQQAVPSRENLNTEASLNLALDDWLTREDLRL
nr:hypothetical protein CFP56_77219 [Quercus suber]